VTYALPDKNKIIDLDFEGQYWLWRSLLQQEQYRL